MADELRDKFAAIRNGLLEYAVLAVVSAKKVYAADIVQALAGTEFATQEGTLYPLLSRLRRERKLEYEWAESAAGPPRKYYRLTAEGRAHLQDLDGYWIELNKTIKKLKL